MNYKSFLTDTWTKFSQLFSKFVKKTFVGTRAEWDLLSVAEKKQYDLADFTDDTASGVPIISDTVAEGDMNAVTSNAVAAAIATATTAIATTIGEFTDLGSFGTLNAAGAKIYTDAVANISAGSSGLYCVNVTGIGYLFGRVYRVGAEAHGVFTVQENGNAIKRIYSWSRWSTMYSAQYWGYAELTDA